jgi:hypothetical protein
MFTRTSRPAKVGRNYAARVREGSFKPQVEGLEERTVPQGTIGFNVLAADFFENAGPATISVARTGSATGAVSVQFATRDASAVAGTNYTATQGTLSWANGDTTDKTISVPLTSDGDLLGNKSFGIELLNATGGATISTVASAAAITIKDANGDQIDRFINDTYLTNLARPSDAPGRTNWKNQITAGRSRAAVALDIINSPESLTVYVNKVYAELLGRAGDPSGVAGWVSFLQMGGSRERMRAEFYGSVEYFTNAGGDNEQWLISVYQDAMGRNPDDVAFGWLNFLRPSNPGEPGHPRPALSRGQVATLILAQDEPRTAQIETYYTDILDRQSDPTGITGWLAAVKLGLQEQAVQAEFFGSAEYLVRL